MFQDNVTNLRRWPTLRIRNWVTKHVQKDGLQQLIELGDGFAAFAAKRVGLVQNRRDAALLRSDPLRRRVAEPVRDARSRKTAPPDCPSALKTRHSAHSALAVHDRNRFRAGRLLYAGA